MADDDESIVRMLCTYLSAWGYQPLAARDGATALAMLEADGAPQAAILDWMMPGLSGVDVLRALRSRAGAHPSADTLDGCSTRVPTRALLLTARGAGADLAEAFAAGAEDYVSKPFDPIVLRARLGAMLARSGITPDQGKVVGSVLDGRYRLDECIGAGGMGAVFRATHLALRRTVAIKVVRSDRSQLPQVRERFEREARSAASIESPNVARVLDFGVTREGHAFLVMEHLVGQTLEQRLERVGVLEPGEAVELVDGIAHGLEAAHRLGVIHRDIKPGNVFLAEQDGGPPVPKLIDFGLAKLSGPQAGVTVTGQGEVLGTVGFMSAAQLFGEEATFDCDLWGLAATAAAALIGHSPFEAEIQSMTILNTLQAPPPQLSLLRPGLPVELDAWAESAFSHEARLRFGSASELAYAFSVAASRARHFRRTPFRPTV